MLISEVIGTTVRKPATPAPALTARANKVGGTGPETGSPLWNQRHDDGTRSVSDERTGNTVTSGAGGKVTRNYYGQKVQHQTPKFAGVQKTTQFDPNTGKQVGDTATNYQGNLDTEHGKVNVNTNINPDGSADMNNMSLKSGNVTAARKNGNLSVNYNHNGQQIDMRPK